MSYLLQRKEKSDVGVFLIRAGEFQMRILKPNTKRRVTLARKPQLLFARLVVLQNVTAQRFGKADVG